MSIRRVVTAAVLAASALATVGAVDAAASKSQWSMFEDPRYLTTDPARRAAALPEIKALGADTLRVTLRWDSVAPNSGSRNRPSSFDATNSNAYPGFGPYDELIAAAHALGLRIHLSISGHVPRWAREGRSGYKGTRPVLGDFRDFVKAVVTRYSGIQPGLPKVNVFGIWHEPNQPGWLAPQSSCKRGRCTPLAPSYYRQMVRAAYPVIKSLNRDAFVIISQLAPSGTDKPGARRPLRPLTFLRAFGCRDARMRAIRSGPCKGFQAAMGDGFGHHPYATYARFESPYAKSPSPNDASIGDTRQLLKVLDGLTARRAIRVAGGGRFGIYFTEFGIQTNPPDPFRKTSLSAQAAFINESEEYCYRNPRIKSYSQYTLYDEPPLAGSSAKRWSAFQMGLRLPNGNTKPAHNAYKLPLVVKKRGSGVTIWGRVRPGTGTRYVQIQQKRGGSFRNVGGLVTTNSAGYFSARRATGTYRFEAYEKSDRSSTSQLGRSRVAKPVKAAPRR